MKKDHKSQPFHYWQCGLDYVYLTNGVRWRENSYGRFFTITDIDELHTLIAHEIITSPNRLCGQELRFLRSLLGMSQGALANNMGLTRGAIAKCEGEPHKPLSGEMDRLLRFIYLINKNHPELYSEMASLMDDIAEREYHRGLKLKHKETGWHMNNGKKVA